MLTNQTAPQKLGATGPLPGRSIRGIAPVVAAVQGVPNAHPANFTAFVTADLRFDIPAIRAEAKALYATKLDFINRYSGTAKRYWQRAQARQAIRMAWREAREQHHRIVTDLLPIRLPYIAEEATRRAELRSTIVGLCPASASGMADFKAASGEYARINDAARQRAILAIIEAVRVACSRTS